MPELNENNVAVIEEKPKKKKLLIPIIAAVVALCLIITSIVVVSSVNKAKAEEAAEKAEENVEECENNIKSIKNNAANYVAVYNKPVANIEELESFFAKRIPECPLGGEYTIAINKNYSTDVICPNCDKETHNVKASADKINAKANIIQDSGEEYETYTDPKHVVPTNTVLNGLGKMYYTVVSYWKVSVLQTLQKCAIYDSQVYDYEETKTEFLSEEEIAEFENGAYGQYAETTYFVLVEGEILQNPEIPGLYSSRHDLVLVWLVFDENDQLVGGTVIDVSDSFHNCALLLVSGNY